MMTPILVYSTFGIAGAIVAEAGLSFLGLGAQPPESSWGMMLSEGRKYLLIAPHITTFPGLAIMIVVLGLNLLGDGLRDRFDIKM
jgi:peptide/nickel transport system permease protein